MAAGIAVWVVLCAGLGALVALVLQASWVTALAAFFTVGVVAFGLLSLMLWGYAELWRRQTGDTPIGRDL